MHSIAKDRTAANDESSTSRLRLRLAPIYTSSSESLLSGVSVPTERSFHSLQATRHRAINLSALDPAIWPTRKIRRGEPLYRMDDPFQSIYVIRAGNFKTVVTHRDGAEQITGFHIVGESLGLDGVYLGRHNGDATALEDSVVCMIRFTLLETLSREIEFVQHQLHNILSGEIVRRSDLALLLGTMTAEQRVAAFLLDLSARLAERGFSSTDLILRMTRQELGSYLGIKLETVSRMLSQLHRRDLIIACGKRIRILDRLGLSAL